jgi:hypothetical protein
MISWTTLVWIKIRVVDEHQQQIIILQTEILRLRNEHKTDTKIIDDRFDVLEQELYTQILEELKNRRKEP